MTDLERLIINLDGIAEHLEDERLPTLAGNVREAIQMLKERLPVRPSTIDGIDMFCGKCGNSLYSVSRFCEKCGTEVKWSCWTGKR